MGIDSLRKVKIVLLAFLSCTKKAASLVFPGLLITSCWVHEKETGHHSERMKEIHSEKSENIFTNVVFMVQKGCGFLQAFSNLRKEFSDGSLFNFGCI